jgi:hypothetical protein
MAKIHPHAPCRTNGDDEHNHVCPFCGAMPQAECRYEQPSGVTEPANYAT